MYPAEFKYTKEHEWVRVDGSEAVVGITDFAQKQLGDVVFIDLPAAGKVLKQGDVFGTIESVKAVSELFAPLSGEVIAVNDEVGQHPEAVNAKPHESWMIRVKVSQPAETGALLTSSQYTDLVK